MDALVMGRESRGAGNAARPGEAWLTTLRGLLEVGPGRTLQRGRRVWKRLPMFAPEERGGDQRSGSGLLAKSGVRFANDGHKSGVQPRVFSMAQGFMIWGLGFLSVSQQGNPLKTLFIQIRAKVCVGMTNPQQQIMALGIGHRCMALAMVKV